MNEISEKDTRKKTDNHIKKDAHTGRRSDLKPKMYEDGNIIREVKNKHRNRMNRVYHRARKISEKVRVNNDLKNDLYMNFVDFDDIEDDDLSNYETTSFVTQNKQTPIEFANLLGYTIMNLFMNGDVDAAIEDLKQLYNPEYKRLIIYIVIEKSLNFKNKHRELLSRYLAAASMAEILDEYDFMKGFDLLLSDLNDLEIDFPEASMYVATFMARALADECLPPIYLRNQLNHQKQAIIIKCLKYTKFLYRNISWYIDIDQIWGEEAVVTGIKDLLQAVHNIVYRYFDDKNFEHFFNSITELDVPHFHHAVIREILTVLLTKYDEITYCNVLNLIKHIIDTALMTENQIHQGFISTFDDINKFSMDNENSNQIIVKLTNDLASNLPKSLLSLISNKLQ